MSLLESFTSAFVSLLSNKLRSVLTVLGIIIGVGSVIALQSIGQGFIVSEQKSLERLGTNLVTIQPSSQKFAGITTKSNNTNLTLEDALALDDPTLVLSALAIAPEISLFSTIVVGSFNSFVPAVGTNEPFLAVHDLNVASGEWFSAEDVGSGHLVVVLGASIASALFGKTEEVPGSHIQLQGQTLSVIGVLASKGQERIDQTVYVPITTVQQRLSGKRPAGASNTGSPVSTIILKATGQAEVDFLVVQATDLLRERHKLEADRANDFEITTQADQLQEAKDQFASLNVFLAVVASITLLVGGIGIMNIMLVTVTERTREIGIRKAIGARPHNILLQFMIESVALSFVGGVLGMVAGIGSSVLISNANLSIAGSALHPVVSPLIVAIALGAALLVGLFFGIYPARRASKLTPIDALRYE